jgi:hypothetical protein
MRSIAKRWIFGFFTAAQVNCRGFLGRPFQGGFFAHAFVRTIAQRLFVAEATAAPAIGFALFYIQGHSI